MPPRLPRAPHCLRLSSPAVLAPIPPRLLHLLARRLRPEPHCSRFELPGPILLQHSRFSTVPRRQINITNPRGPEHTITITPRAVTRLKALQEQDGNPKLALRVTVESGGCHGFQYNMSLSDQVDAEEDTVFEEDGALVVMDEPSLELLKGSKVDYTMELIGSQFKIADNPEATSSCGCGTSFDIKGL